MKKTCALMGALIIILACLVGCESSQKKQDSQFDMKLNSKVEYVIVGEQYRLIPQAGNSSDHFVWSSDDESVAQVKRGLVTAVAAGECSVSVAGKTSRSECKVVVCDSMVDKEFDNSSLDFNRRRFDNLQSAVNYGGTVVVMQGSYAEQLVLPQKVKIIAVGDVKVLSIYGDEFSLIGLSIQSSIGPQENNALVYANKSMQLDKCSIMVSTNDSADMLKGGSAIGILGSGANLVVKDCAIANFAIGVNIQRFVGRIDISNNRLANCGIGVLVNVRAAEKMIDDYPTSGKVRGNSFSDNKVDAKFLFGSDSYSGRLDFYDFTSAAPK